METCFVDVYYYMENRWLCDNMGTPEACENKKEGQSTNLKDEKR